MGKNQVTQSLYEELTWNISALKVLQEGIEMVKEQRELLQLPLDLSISLIPPKKQEDIMIVASRAEAELRRGEKDPIVYLYTKLVVDHFRELRTNIERNYPENRELQKFLSSVREQQALDNLVESMIEGLEGLLSPLK